MGRLFILALYQRLPFFMNKSDDKENLKHNTSSTCFFTFSLMTQKLILP